MLRDFYSDFGIMIIYIEIFLLWELCIYFIISSIGDRRGKRVHFNINMSMYTFFSCYSCYKIFSLIYLYYTMDELYHLIARVSLIVGALLFIIIVNQIFFKQIFKNDRNRQIFVAILLGSAIILSILYFYYSNLEVLVILLSVLAVLISILFYKSFKWFLTLGDKIKTYVSIFGIGCILFVAGAAASRVVQYLPGSMTLIPLAYSIETIGVMLLGIGAWKSPNLSEIEWQNKLINLYAISPTGICLFKHAFKPVETMDSLLVGGGITSIVKMVKEMTKSEQKLSIIKQTNRNMFLEYGKYVTVVLLVEEEFEILRQKLKEFLLLFEEFFRDILPSWKNDLQIFTPAEVLVEKIFGKVIT